MPEYSSTDGITLKKQDICGGCMYFPAQCGIYTKLRFNGRDSEYHDITIVLPGDEKGRDGFVGCKGFRKAVSPKDKVDRDPHFGQRIPVQLFNLEHGNAVNTPQTLRQ